MVTENSSIYSKQFLRQNWDKLVSFGLPLAIIGDEKYWIYFIEHFDHPNVPCFKLDQLNKDSLKGLRATILAHDEYAQEHIFVQRLQRLISSKR